jgi:N-acetylmuramoyl-L-alanine amidase
MKHQCGRSWLAGILALSLLLSASSEAAPLAVKDVRLWAGPDATRLVFDLSGPTTHRLQTLQNPDRVVLDIPAARIEGGKRSLPQGQGFIRQLRTSTQGNGDLRFVIELAAPAAPRSFAVEPSGSYGHRLVVDLASAASATPSVVKSTHDGPGRDIIVAIDAGHGGTDPGASGRSGTREKDITLAIARRLKERIDKEPGMRAVLTRDGDYFLAHRERIRRARDQQASMFISVHADAYRDRSVAGSSVYVLSQKGASDEAARWLAERENAADLLGGVSLEDKDDVLASVLLDLSQGASMSASIEAAENVLHELYSVGNIKRRTVQHARFLVLKSPDIPSMLVETAFITNPGEESRLKDPRHQQRLADAIHSGVRSYFYANPPPGSRIAELRDQAVGMGVVASTSTTQPGAPPSGISP